MVYNMYKKWRIIHFHQLGHKPPTIAKLLKEENLKVSCVGVDKFIARFLETGLLRERNAQEDYHQSQQKCRQSSIQEDDETTAYQFRELLLSYGYSISRRTVLRCRLQLGWTFRGSAYYLIRNASKIKRLDWFSPIHNR